MRKFALPVLAGAIGIVAASLVPLSAAALTPGVSFGAADLSTWQVNNEVYGMASVRGVVVAGGSFTQVSPPSGVSGTPVSTSGLAILNAETGAPTSCRLALTLSGGTPVVRTVVASPDGSTVYLGGNFSTVGGVSRTRVAAIDPVACRVLPLTVSGVGGQVLGMAATGSTLYLAGQFNQVAGQTRNNFAAVRLSDGALLPWTAQSATIDLPEREKHTSTPYGRAIAVSPDGSKVALGGDFFSINGVDSHSIAVVDGTTGAVIQAYPRGFIDDYSVTKAIWSDGTNFYVGNEGTGGGVFDGRLAVSWSSLQQIWRDTCLGATQALQTYKGTLYVASHAHDCSSNNAFTDGRRNFFLAEGTTTPTVYQWFPTANDGIGEGIGPRAMTIGTGTTSGKDFLWFGGEFTQVNGHAQQGLTRFGPDDTTTPPVPVISTDTTTANTVWIRFRTVVDPDDGPLTYRIYRNGSTTPIWTGTASSLWYSRPQVSVADTNVTAGTRYTYRVTASDGVNTSALSGSVAATPVSSASAYASRVIADGPSEYLRMDEASGTWAQDKSGATTAGRNGLYKFGVTLGAAGALAGDSDSAATFDGSTGYIYGDQQIAAPSTYSIESWFKTTTTSGGKIVGFGSGQPNTGSGATNLSGNYDRQIYMDNSGRLTFGTWVGYAATIKSAAAYNDGGWHHVVATQGSSGMALYVDGKRVGTNSNTGAQAYNGNWHIGGDSLNGWPDQPASNFFAGTIDDTAIYPAALSARTVAEHYQVAGGTVSGNTTPTDAYGARVFNDDPSLYWRLDETSGSTAHDSSFADTSDGTYGPGVQLGGSGATPTGRSARFLGSDSSGVATATSGPGGGAFSTETWFRTTSTSGGKLIGFEDAATGTGSNYDKQVYMTNDGRLVGGVYAGYVAAITSPSSYNDGRWHHVVFEQGPSGLALYVDGALIGTNGETGNQSFTGYWRIGGGNINGWPDQPASYYFSGDLDEVAVYGSALDAGTIAAHYQAGQGSGDTVAPSAPTGVSTSVSGADVTVSWTAATDNVGVTGYSLYRSLNSDVQPTPDNRVATGITGTSTVDAGRDPGTYFYAVAATDAAGNVSPLSGTASAVVAPPADTTPPTAPTGVVADVAGSAVTVSWTQATDDRGVTGYSVYRGTTADFTPSAATLRGSTTDLRYRETSVAPSTYYYKVTASDAAGNVGPASSPATATVAPPPDTTAPSVPSSVATSVTGTTVSVTWSPSTDDTGVTGYTVYRGTSAGFTADASSAIGTTATTSYTDPSRPVGTAYYRVSAMDAAGNASAASASVSASVSPPPDTTAPTAPTGLAAAVNGGSAALTWTASTDDTGVVSYGVYRGTTSDFAASAANRIATVTATSYTDSGLATGTYYYRVTASDAAGNVSDASTSASATVAPASQTVTRTVSPTADAMTVKNAATTNYGTYAQLSSAGGSSPSVSYLRFDIPAAPSGTTLTGASLAFRTSTDPSAGSTDSHQVSIASNVWDESTVNWNSRPEVTGPALGTISGATAVNTAYSAALNASLMSGRVGTTVTIALSDTGSDNLRTFSQNATSASQRPTLTLTYTSGAPADSTPPSTPSAVTATVSGTTATIGWTAATDASGIGAYRVYRGSSADFTPAAANQVATVSGTSYSDAGLAPGTYFWKVIAVDTVGNAGSPSSAASATVTAQPTTVVAGIIEDAYVAESAPTTNYGTNVQLSSSGNANGAKASSSYLRFAIPATPAGMRLVGASLSVRTSTDPAAGSTATHTFAISTGDWTESTVTWATRPTARGAALGTLSGATALNTVYTSSWDPAVVGTYAGTSMAVALDGDPSTGDNVRLFSSNASASQRPVLTLSYLPL